VNQKLKFYTVNLTEPLFVVTVGYAVWLNVGFVVFNHEVYGSSVFAGVERSGVV
jgi:hypothetical protein